MKPSRNTTGILLLIVAAFVGLLLARRIGRPLLTLLVRHEALQEWEELLGIRSVPVWGVLFFVLNLDFVVMLSGLTSLPLRQLWIAAMIARTPWLVASAWLGSAVLVSDTVLWLALIVLIPVLYLLNRLRPRIRHWMLRFRPRSGAHADAAPEQELTPGSSSRDS